MVQIMTAVNGSNKDIGKGLKITTTEKGVQNKNIRKVSLRGNVIQDKGAFAFGGLLKILSLRLESLDMSHNAIHDEGGQEIAFGL